MIQVEFMNIQKTQNKGNSGEQWHSRKETPETAKLCSSIVTKFLMKYKQDPDCRPVQAPLQTTQELLPHLISSYTTKS